MSADRGGMAGLRSAAARSVWAVGCAAVLLLTIAAPLYAHLALRSAVPAADADVDAVPAELRLSFTEPVEFALAMLTLTGPQGAVALSTPGPDGDDRQVMLAAIEGALIAGEYRVDWQAVGLDGHPVRGSYSFRIAEGAEGLAAPEAPPEAADTLTAIPIAEPGPAEPAGVALEDATSNRGVLYAATRWLGYASFLVLVGALAFRALLVHPRIVSADPGRDFLARAARGASAVGLLAAAGMLVALPLRLQAQAHSIFGAGITGERFALLLDTLWGQAWALQAGGVVLAFAGLLLARRREAPVEIPMDSVHEEALLPARRREAPGWLVTAVAVAVLSITPGMSGHAAATGDGAVAAIAADALHLLAAGAWLGTLLVLVVVALPLLRAPEYATRPRLFASLVTSYSPLALGGAAVLVATGVYAASLHLTGAASLISSAYGRVLIGKLLLFLVVLGAGFYNWRRLGRRLEAPGAPRQLSRSAALELTATTLVLLMTSILVAIPPPAHAAPDAGHDAAAVEAPGHGSHDE